MVKDVRFGDRMILAHKGQDIGFVVPLKGAFQLVMTKKVMAHQAWPGDDDSVHSKHSSESNSESVQPRMLWSICSMTSQHSTSALAQLLKLQCFLSKSPKKLMDE